MNLAKPATIEHASEDTFDARYQRVLDALPLKWGNLNVAIEQSYGDMQAYIDDGYATPASWVTIREGISPETIKPIVDSELIALICVTIAVELRDSSIEPTDEDILNEFKRILSQLRKPQGQEEFREAADQHGICFGISEDNTVKIMLYSPMPELAA